MALDEAYAHAHYVTINISSPNTQSLRSLQQDDALETLLAGLKSANNGWPTNTADTCRWRSKLHRTSTICKSRPLLPALRRHRFDAVIATNTTLERAAVMGDPHARVKRVASRANQFLKNRRPCWLNCIKSWANYHLSAWVVLHQGRMLWPNERPGPIWSRSTPV